MTAPGKFASFAVDFSSENGGIFANRRSGMATSLPRGMSSAVRLTLLAMTSLPHAKEPDLALQRGAFEPLVFAGCAAGLGPWPRKKSSIARFRAALPALPGA